jgi:hypothetical protein
MNETNSTKDRNAIKASIFLDLVISNKISSFVSRFVTRYPQLNVPPNEARFEDLASKLVMSTANEDSDLRDMLTEIIALQKRRFAVYKFTGCAESGFYTDKCEPKITCPTGGTPPCCIVEGARRMLTQGKFVREDFKTIVFWDENVTIKAFDNKMNEVTGQIEVIGIVDSLIISKIDFSTDFDDVFYIKISDPSVLIPLPPN